MKSKHVIFLLFFLSMSFTVEAQFLKKLKDRATKAAERAVLNKTEEKVSKTTENTMDTIFDTSGSKNSPQNKKGITKYDNPSLKNNTKAKKSWYTSDLRVTSYDKDKQSDMISYFDADAVAMQSNYKDQRTGEPVTSYIDSDGFFISYNASEGQHNKSQLLNMPGMSMMAPSMMGTAYKLPVGAIYEAMEKMENKGLAVYPFMHVDFPFVLKPEHFRDEMAPNQYNETKQSCRGSMGCTKFSVQESGYIGSYTLFDNQDRLVEINVMVEGDPFYGSGKGKIEYFYEECDIKLPAAVEKKMFGQDLLKKGLDPNKN